MKLYSYNFELLAYLDDVVVSYDGVLGNISTLTFTFPKYQYDHAEGKMVEDSRYNYIVNEAVIEYDGEHYLIKEAIPLREGTYVAKEVVCKSLAVEWSGTKVDGHWGFSPMIDHFEYPYNEPATLEMALNDLIGKYLNGWSIGVLPEVEKRRTFDFEWSTPMQIITDLAKVYDYTPRFRTEIVNGELKKYIDILDKDYGDIKGYYRHDSTLDTIRIPINTDAITTRLFLFGYDNLTINDLPEETKEVNGITYPIHEKGKSYIQNFDYYLAQGYTYEDCLEKFVKVDYESDDLYVDAEDLYQYGKERIAQIGVPQMAYTVSIKDIEFSGKPKIELGHNIRVVDEELNIDMICRVSKISYTSDDKENKTIEITNYATYMTEMDLLTDLMVKHENLSQGAIKKYSKFAGSLVFSDNTGLTVQAPVEGQMNRASTDSLEGKLVRDVVKLGIYEKDKYGIQILDGQLQLDREDGLTRVKIDNTEGIIIYNNPEADGFTDDHRVFYVDNEGNLVAEKITVRNGFFYLKDGQEIEAVIGGINNSIGNIEGSIDGIEGSITEIEKEQVRLDELTKAENIINTVTQSQQYIDDLLSKVDSTVAEEESKRIEGLINTATSVDRIVSTVTQSQQYINDLKDKASNTAVEQQKRDLEELINTATSAERIITTVTESDKYVNDLLEKADSATVDATINNVKNELQNNINSVDGKVGEAVLEIDKTKESLSLKANKTEVYTKAETDTALNDKANQTDLNSVTERVSTTEAELRVQADQIATKVEKKTYETAIGSINDSLSGKADTTTVNGVIERVTTAESSIVQNAEAIATKVSNTTYQQDKKNLETRMTSAESSITQNAEGIALKANKTDVYTKGETDNKVGAVSEKVSAVESSLEVQAGQISSKVSKTDYEKDMTSVGTRLSSAESSITQNADAIVQKVSKTEYAQDKKGITDRLSSAESSITQNAEAIALKASKTELTTGLSGKADNSTVTALSGKVSTVESELKVQADQIKQTVSKIEYDGTIEELQGAIDGKADSSSLTALSDRVTTAESAITQNADQIATKVSNTTYQQDKKNLETRVTSAESAITQQAESISLKANKTDVYTKAEADSAVGAVSEKVSAVESELKVQAGQITQKVSKTDYDKAMNGVNERLTTAESNITQTAESIEQKVSKTEYAQDQKGITDRLTSAESSISQQADQIALKASKTELNSGLANKADNSTVTALSGKVSTVESQLTVQAEQISQKVSKTEYSGDIEDLQNAIDGKANGSDLTALAGRVTTAESSITQNANAITQKVSKTDYDKGMANKADNSTVSALGTRLTTAETTLTQQANSIALKANKTDVYTKGETDSKIDNIKIGGTNLLKDSNFEIGYTWKYKGDAYRVQEGRDGSYCGRVDGTIDVTHLIEQQVQLEANTEYTITAWVKTEDITGGSTNPFVQIYTSYFLYGTWVSENCIVNLLENGTSDWAKYTATFTTPNKEYDISKFSLYVRDITGTIWVDDLKLEKGNKATDWSPHPDDIDTKVSAIEAELEVQADQISQRVTKTDYQQDKQSMETRLTTAEASIKTNADSIKQTVTKTEWTQDKNTINNAISNKADNSTVTGINNRLTSAEGSISTLAGEVALKASKTDVYTKAESDQALSDKADSSELSGVIDRIESAEAEIKVNADSITQTVKKTDYTGEKVVSMINQSADSIKISAKHVDINGAVTFSSFDTATQNKINTIESTATSASNTASTAKSTADTAKSTADIAKSTADSAKTTASTASTNASNALSTANTAKNTADTANSTATTANNKLNNWSHSSDTTMINGGKIYTNSITANQIASNSITASKISAGAITADKIASKTITADKLHADVLSANSIVSIINGGSTTINGSKITTGTIVADTITSGTFKGTNFVAGGSTNGNGYISVLNASNDALFRADKEGLYAKNIVFATSPDYNPKMDGYYWADGYGFHGESGYDDGTLNSWSQGIHASIEGIRLEKLGEYQVNTGVATVEPHQIKVCNTQDTLRTVIMDNLVSTTGELNAGTHIRANGEIIAQGTITSRGAVYGSSFLQTNYAIPLEVGRYIDLHNPNSTNDVDVRLDTGGTRDRLRISGGADLSRYIEVGMNSNGGFIRDSPSGKYIQMRTDRLTYDGATVPHNWRQNFTPFIFSDTGNFNMVESWGEAVYLGDLVWIRGRVRGSRGGHSGSVYIGGLPVSCKAGYPALDIAFFGGVTASLGNGGFDIRAYFEENASHCIITYSNKDTGGWHNLQCSHVTTGNMDISFSATYRWR